MFLHLGGDVVVAEKDIISIHDYGIFSSGVNREFLQRMREQRCLIVEKEEKPKSLVLTTKGIYVSAISSLTLKRRTGGNFIMDKNMDAMEDE